ncbi:loricrin, putative [Trichomonas vaginalis G3]|uniref:receptor protein-tyrosine kinase n=1 Tax=Trichomonas vaginalis (strain ATCC PRA-98 / G3) TaxID=412133 RepID=A2G4R5_TRIV3|nr:glycine-rich protein family [Trichomonas vaginalis G3]EAX87859.1 loricrin, putative [Trichomonas vaginalis G3]KAI5504913.1 glycine-rich protein family [Trichomonas vaginalis G3]|eukprot:XP_001300789.1 loricrin [Trichomonas vaginalis G3]
MSNYSYGGGGPGQLGGGGATDIRLLPGNYDNYTSLKSRIIVAAGAGASDTSDVGGPGGTIEGFNSKRDYGKGGTQTSGGQGNIDGSFGKGGENPNRIDGTGNGAGGSGYFGGGSLTNANDCGGGGGSSFISGYPGCVAITGDSTENLIKFRTGYFKSIHYSGLKFEDPIMINGKSEMPSPNGSIETGHSGNGYIRITSFSLCVNSSIQNIYHFYLLFLLIFESSIFILCN